MKKEKRKQVIVYIDFEVLNEILEIAKYNHPREVISYSHLSNLELFEFLIRLYLLQIQHICRTINDEEILLKFNFSTKFP